MTADVVSVIGARPQFVKAAIVSKALEAAGISENVIHTGQHYDPDMSDTFLAQLGITVTSNLGIGSGTQGHQTAKMIQGIEDFLTSGAPPSAVLLYGDTNSTLAGALVASKLHIPLVHVEAGLRSFNRVMPEEVNRVLVDHVSSLLFCPSDVGVANLAAEGIIQGVHNVGDVMLDAFNYYSVDLGDNSLWPKEGFVLATIHRPANADNLDKVQGVLDSLMSLKMPVIWPVHPRIRPMLQNVEVPIEVTLVDPMDYFSMLAALKHCSLVVTDSGGLQKEAYWAKKPCLTLRTDTEWTETLNGDWNQLCNPGDDLWAFSQVKKGAWQPLYGDGKAGEKIVQHISSYLR